MLMKYRSKSWSSHPNRIKIYIWNMDLVTLTLLLPSGAPDILEEV